MHLPQTALHVSELPGDCVGRCLAMMIDQMPSRRGVGEVEVKLALQAKLLQEALEAELGDSELMVLLMLRRPHLSGYLFE